VLGNQDLDPEVIDTYEIAMDYMTSYDLRIGFNIFYYNIEDLIQFVPDSNGASSTAQNTGRQNGRGVEIEFDWDASKTFSLLGHLAFQNSEDRATKADAPNSPEHQAYLGGNWKFSPAWLLSIQAHWIADRNRLQGDPRMPVDDYSYFDLSIQKQNHNKGWRIVAGIRNLFDEERSEPSPTDFNFPSGSAVPGDFPLEQRSYYLEASYSY
jgi:iron complex outermembrane receptor protein